jgi:MFS family permease
MLAIAGANVSEVVLAKVSFDAGDFGYGLLVGATGIGLALGSLFASSFLEARSLAAVYAGAIAVVAAGMVLAAVSPGVWVAAACIVIVGAGNGTAVVCNALLVQRGAPDELRGRAFTVLMSSNYVVLGVGMLVAGPLTDVLGARAVWGIAGALSAVGAVIALVMARGVQAQPEAVLQPSP